MRNYGGRECSIRLDTDSRLPGAGGFDGVARQASIRFSGLAFDKLLGYAFAIIITKTYGPADLGFYIVGVGLIEVLLSLTRLGQDQAAVRAVAGLVAAGKRVEIKGVLRTSLAFTIPPAVAVAALVLVVDHRLAAALSRPNLAYFLGFAVVSLPAANVADSFLWISEGLGRQKYLTLVRMVLEPTVKTALSLALFLALGSVAGAQSLGLAYTASIVVSAACAYFVYRRVVLPLTPGRPTEPNAAELLRVGLPICGLSVLTRLLGRAEVFLIFTLISARATAHFIVAQRTALLTTMIALAVDAAFRPAMASALTRGLHNELRHQFSSVSRRILMLCLPACVVLVCFPSRVMAVVGDQFVGAAPVVALITIGTVASFIAGPSASALVMAGRSRISLANGLVAGGLGLALDIMLIPRFGLFGAGVAQCGSMVVSNFLNACSARRLLGVSGVGRDHLRLLIPITVAAAAGMLMNALAPANKYSALALIGISVLVAYALSVAAVGVTPEDKRLARDLFAGRQRREFTSTREARD